MGKSGCSSPLYKYRRMLLKVSENAKIAVKVPSNDRSTSYRKI